MDEDIEQLVVRWIVAPVIVVLGMYITGVVLDGVLETTGTFRNIFLGLGGVGAVAYYFSSFWRGSS